MTSEAVLSQTKKQELLIRFNDHVAMNCSNSPREIVADLRAPRGTTLRTTFDHLHDKLQEIENSEDPLAEAFTQRRTDGSIFDWLEWLEDMARKFAPAAETEEDTKTYEAVAQLAREAINIMRPWDVSC